MKIIKIKNEKKNIAIVGMSCRFPSGVETPEEYWNLLTSKKSAIQALPGNRWQWPDYIDVVNQHRGIDQGGFLDSIDQFDAAHFCISPREAKMLDPQQRFLLELSRHCFDDAGYETDKLMGSNVAVYIGVSHSDYNELLSKDVHQTGGYLGTGSGLFAAANRISYFYNFTGPSISIDTASSSSMVALCQAVDALQNEICDSALAGGIHLMCTPTNSIAYYQAGMLSPDGRCKSFDATANGYVRGEGAGLLFLKRLKDAKRDGDKIYGVIQASGYGHGGHTSSITVPNASAQAALIENIYRKSNCDLNSVSYIETHGSGTPVGDPIEIEGLKKAFSSFNKKSRFYKIKKSCGLGSVKSVIGHLEAASGIAGVIKVLMAMKYKQLPATLNHHTLNPAIELEKTPFFITDETIEWQPQCKQRRAGISSFGLGGVNAHVMIEEYTKNKFKRQALPAFPFSRERFWIEPLKLAQSNLKADNLQQEICLIMADILEISASQIMPDKEMTDLGFDSLAFRELSKRLSEKYQRQITPMLFFEVHTLTGLTQFLKGRDDKLHKPQIANNGDIAIIGMAGEFPQSKNLNEFWNNLYAGKDLVSEIPIDRVNHHEFKKMDWHIRQAGFIDNVENFDAALFNISPVEAELMDPQQRRLLQIIWQSLSDARLTPESLSGTQTGVFVGVMNSDYSELLAENQIETEAYTSMGTSHAMLANKISFYLNLQGPSEVIDTACSSSLVALHRAVESIKRYECEAAFVAGVNLILTPRKSLAFNKAGMLSKDGRCQTFDINANGYVRAEAVTAILIKPLTKAIEDGDVIHAVIKGSAVNHGGRATSLTAPNANAQANCLLAAYQKANIDPKKVSYLELHGTGTSLGDPIEITGIKKAFFELYHRRGYPFNNASGCGLGSLKSNMGHAEAAAGLSGLIKVVLAMKNRILPGNLHLTKINPLIELDDSPFFIVEKTQPWQSDELRSAGISSFGFGGVNAHVVLEEYLISDSQHQREKRQSYHFNENRYWLPGLKEESAIHLKSCQWIKCDKVNRQDTSEKQIVILIEPYRICDDNLDHIRQQIESNQVTFIHYHSDLSTLAARYEEYACQLFEYIKSIIRSNHHQKISLQVISSADKEASVYLGLSALLKTTMLENPSIVCQFIAIENKIGLSELLNIMVENRHASEQDIRYVGMERQVLRWQDIPIEKKLKWKDKGVYLITGGLGGLGAMVINDIAHSALNPIIIIFSRSNLDAKKIRLIKQIEDTGAIVNYMQVDVADCELMQQKMHEITNQYGQLNGVIHAAGIISDHYILTKSNQEFKDVLASKVMGTENLDQMTKHMNLDFFMTFSSFVSCLGNAGQADYATANGYMDAYMQYRHLLVTQGERTGQSISINWPLWSEGGMSVDHETEKMFYERLGMEPLSSQQGMHALHAILALSLPRVMVVTGNIHVFNQHLLEGLKKNLDASSIEKVNSPQSDIISAVSRKLAEMFSETAKIPLSNIESDMPLWEYGMDSIMIVALNKKLEDALGHLSKTLFFEYKTIDDLAAYLVGAFNKKCAEWVDFEFHQTPVINVVDSNSPITKSNQYEPIAIVGIAGRYPGANHLSQLWNNLKNGVNGISEVPSDRWDWREYYMPDRNEAGAQNKSYCKWGGFIDGFNEFDSMFFHISPREALNIDPQERLFIQTTWEALEDAGYTRRDLANYKVGVFAGVTKTGFELLKNDFNSKNGFSPHTSFSSIANRVSHFLDLSGPSLAIDTMCSSSLVAIHEAARHLQDESCELAIAGGVNLYLHPSNYIYLSQMKMLSDNDKNASFGEQGSGFVPGEGVGVIILKRLSHALRDKDIIHGIIRGSEINHDGRTLGYTVPNPDAQRRLIKNAIEKSTISPDEISYIEAHGTGTKLGDPIEITGLIGAFSTVDPTVKSCTIGSIKSNIGHLEAAAGIAGVSKIVLQMKHQKIAPSLHSEVINTNIHLSDTPFTIQQKLAEWISDKTRIAGVSSFGAGGVNAHVIIEEYRSNERSENKLSDSELLIVWSSRHKEGLKNYAKKLLQFIEDHHENKILLPSLLDIAYTLSVHREAWEHRSALVVASIEDLTDQLKTFIHSDQINTFVSNHSVGEAWLKNESIDLGRIYQGMQVKRVSLPTYPFLRKKIWFEEFNEISTDNKFEIKNRVEKPSNTNNESSKMEDSNNNKYKNISIQLSSIEDFTPQVSLQKNHSNISDIKNVLRHQLSQLLFVDESDLKDDQCFTDLGLDSIIGFEWVKQIRQHYQISLQTTKLYDYSTLQTLSDYINEKIVPVPVPQTVTTVVPPKVKLQDLPEAPIKTCHTPKVASADNPVTPLPDLQVKNHHKIAIIGMSGRYPGANNIDEFQHNLWNGVDSITEISHHRWDSHQHNAYSRWLGAVSDVDKFDPLFFNLSPLEAECMDPQQRLFLQEAWKAFEDACYTPSQLDGIKCGSYVGIMQNDYWQLLTKNNEHIGSAHAATGNSSAIFAARLAYYLNLKGPAIAIDTACSSSLVATHLACQALNSHEIDMALVGGATLYLDVDSYHRMCDAGMLSKSGKCYTFDNRADGFVPGEAVAALVLKRLDDAIRDEDMIHGVIIASGINQDGKTNGITAPSVNSQINLLKDIYSRANINPETISYIEAHGTATKLGDPIEVEALTEVFKKANTPAGSCAIGSVKTNVGHTSAAAGIVSLQKVILSMKNKRLFPSLHFENLNEHIEFDQSPFYVNTTLKEWKTSNNVRRAGVSSFGFSGTNAHLIIEEYQPNTVHPTSQKNMTHVIPLSAKKSESLYLVAKQLLQFLTKHREIVDIRDVAYSLQIGRQPMPHRIAFVASDCEQLLKQLNHFIDKHLPIHGVYQGVIKNEKNYVQELGSDEDFCATVMQWTIKGKSSQIATAWIEGINIDWRLLYGTNKAKKISLPTYPFLGESYWVKSSKDSDKIKVHEPAIQPVQEVEINFTTYEWKKIPLKSMTAVEETVTTFIFIDMPLETLEIVKLLTKHTVKEINTNDILSDYQRIHFVYEEVFRLVQDILHNKISNQHKLMVVIPNHENGWWYTHLTGLFKSMQLENSKLKGQIIQIPGSLSANVIMKLLQDEMNASIPCHYIKYDDDGVRNVQIIKPIKKISHISDSKLIKDSGVYWITGGLGGLGRILANHLRHSKNAKVILSGRSPVSVEDGFHYIQTDVTDLKQVESTIVKIKEKYGKIDGIIHAAGVIQDAFIINKNKQQYDAVLAAKISGAINIDLATKNEPLDFVVYYSSIAAMTGNLGQADYSTANAFLDKYAEFRNHLVNNKQRYGKTISINWPLWHDGGMQIDQSSKDWFANKTGIIPLSNQQGLTAFAAALTMNDLNQIMVASGDVDKIQAYLGIDQSEDKVPSTVGTSNIDIQNRILNICCDLLKINKSDVDLDTHFTDYGLDSILMIRLLNELELNFGRSIDASAIIDFPTVAKLSQYLLDSGDSKKTQAIQVEFNQPQAENSSSNKVAIIAHACRFPGSSSIEEFWKNLAEGAELITPAPIGRWNANDVLSNNKEDREKSYTMHGGYLDDISEFDAAYFGINDDDALILDPQHRMILELSKELFERAKINPDKISGSHTSVIIGAKENNYLRNNIDLIPSSSLKHMIVNSIGNMMAARVSDFYNLKGQSKTIDTACSSSLVAIHDACDLILSGESEMAIAGGIFLLVDSFAHVGFSRAGVLSDDGKSYVFDERAKGFVLGEGAGLVLLKNYDAAIRDKDEILGVIIGSAVNNDGKTMGLTVPNQEGQKEVIETALKKSQISADLITYLEAHGTGTLLGDPIEVKAASEVYRRYTDQNQYCAIGSVKSNIGHTMTAAGVASLIKVLLSLKHKKIPATINCHRPHPRFRFDETPFYPNTTLTNWHPKNNKRVAAVSSFGFGGTNCHMIIEEMISA